MKKNFEFTSPGPWLVLAITGIIAMTIVSFASDKNVRFSELTTSDGHLQILGTTGGLVVLGVDGQYFFIREEKSGDLTLYSQLPETPLAIHLYLEKRDTDYDGRLEPMLVYDPRGRDSAKRVYRIVKKPIADGGFTVTLEPVSAR